MGDAGPGPGYQQRDSGGCRSLAAGEDHDIQLAYYVQLGAGVAAVLGHSFPVFLKFKGGKGGATCIGVLAYLMPWGIPIYPAIFGLSLAITRFPTMSYSIAFLCFPFLAAFLSTSTSRIAYIIFSVVLLLIPVLRYIPRVKEMHAGAGGAGSMWLYAKT